MDTPAVGIDLGTSNSVIAVVQGDQATVVPDGAGRRTHPSIISFHPNGTVLAGYAARDRRTIDPVNTIFSAKRMIGRPFRSREVQAMAKRVPYKIVEGENQQPLIVARNQQHTVAEISSYVLRYVATLATQHVGAPLEHAVITVPANFDDAQREATRVAGRVAGLNVLRILNEPTAAALAYGYGRGLSTRIAVYDFGGGTFDITILQLNEQVFEVLSTAGDTFLGGDDVDEQIVNQMIEQFVRQHRIDLRFNSSAVARLRGVAEQLKCQLSESAIAVAQVQEVAYGETGQPLDLEFQIAMQQLNTLAGDLVRRTFLICDEALRLANLTATQIDDVVLVGGMTRMPLVRDSVAKYFGRPPRTDINPDEVVAVGAAIQAAILTYGELEPGEEEAAPGPQSVLLDVVPRALGIGVVGGFTETIIRRNAQIPLEQTRRFTTSQDGQTTVRLQICQGEARMFEENQALGELVLEDLPPAARGELQVAVTFEIDTNGLLQVSAVDQRTGRVQKVHVRLIGAASEEQIEALRVKHQELPAPV